MPTKKAGSIMPMLDIVPVEPLLYYALGSTAAFLVDLPFGDFQIVDSKKANLKTRYLWKKIGPPREQLCNGYCSNKHTPGIFLLRRLLSLVGGGGGGGLFVFNDTIEGPRAPAVKPGRVTQA